MEAAFPMTKAVARGCESGARRGGGGGCGPGSKEYIGRYGRRTGGVADDERGKGRMVVQDGNMEVGAAVGKQIWTLAV